MNFHTIELRYWEHNRRVVTCPGMTGLLCHDSRQPAAVAGVVVFDFSCPVTGVYSSSYWQSKKPTCSASQVSPYSWLGPAWTGLLSSPQMVFIGIYISDISLYTVNCKQPSHELQRLNSVLRWALERPTVMVEAQDVQFMRETQSP